MEIKVTKLEHSHVEVDVVVEEARWKEAQEKAFNKLAANVQVDGFRKGKAPANLVKSKIDPTKVFDDALNDILPDVYKEAITSENIEPYAQPEVNITKISDTELEVKFTIVTAPSVVLGAYTNLEIGKEEPSVSDEELANALKDVQSQNGTLAVKEGEVVEGDTVVMDFEGFIDGEAFDGGKAENHELEVGSHSFIPGFEEQLVGHKAGEEFDINVTFPENYVEELKGKDATFKIKLHEVKEKVVPDLTDELVKEMEIQGVETVAQLTAYKKNELLQSKTRSLKNAYFDKLLNAIKDNSEVDIPSEIIQSQADYSYRNAEQRMSQSGLTIEQYLQIVGQTDEDFRKQLYEDATKQAYNFFIVQAVGEKEHIEVDDATLEFEYAKLADQYKMKIEDVKKALEAQVDDFKHSVKTRMIEDYLYQHNN